MLLKFNKFPLGGSGGDVKNSKAYCGVKREPTMFATSFHNTHVYFKTDSHITDRYNFLQIFLKAKVELSMSCLNTCVTRTFIIRF